MHARGPPPGYPNINNIDDFSPLDTAATQLATTSRPYYDDALMRKKRRVDRACDACRRRKTKCDGPKMPKNVCTNCIQSRKNCTYMEESKPRGPSKAYITSLEDKVEQMDALLKMLRPELDFGAELGPPIVRDSWKINPSAHLPTKLHPDPTDKQRSSSHSTSSPTGHPPSMATGTYHKQNVSGKGKPRDPQAGSGEPDDDTEIVRSMRLLNLSSDESAQRSTSSDAPLRYAGKSSGFTLLQKALDAKKDYITAMANGGSMSNNEKPTKRKQFWEVPSWELEWDGLNDVTLIGKLNGALPPEDLCHTLINIWFKNVNIHFPLLHRPTFERQWQSRLQCRDVWFAGLCLSIFAVASRWCNDPRVFPENAFDSAAAASGDINWRGAGQRYYDAALPIHHVRRTMIVQACLAEIQTHAAMSIYLRGTVDIPVAWLCISLGLRKAQDLGAHRGQMYIEPADIVEELWRRVYWILVVLDRLVSYALGRPCCVRETDCDLNLPTEVDDEYWDMDGKPPIPCIQPPGRPALVVGFNYFIRLTQNIELIMNSILVVDTSKLRIGIPRGPKWKEEVIMRTNIDMAKWIDSVPHHLRWSPSMVDQVFSDQAATLYTTYYLMQVMIYRPFTSYGPDSERRKESCPNFPFPASTICINAAKACARILNTQMRRDFSNVTNLISASYLPAMLLMDAWKTDTKKSMSILDTISIFVEALNFAALRWDSAYYLLQNVKAALPHSMREPMPRHPPEHVDPLLSIGFDGRTIPHEPDNLHQFVPSLPIVLPDPIEIATPIDSVPEWFPMLQSSMCVPASYPPRNYHYLDNSSQSTWSEQPQNDYPPSIYDNQPPPNRLLTRTYSIDNFNLPSYPTPPVPVPSTRQVASAWEPQALTMQAGRHPVPHFEDGEFFPRPTLPMDISMSMHNRTHNEQALTWNGSEEFHYGHRQFNQGFEQSSTLGTGYPQERS